MLDSLSLALNSTRTKLVERKPSVTTGGCLPLIKNYSPNLLLLDLFQLLRVLIPNRIKFQVLQAVLIKVFSSMQPFDNQYMVNAMFTVFNLNSYHQLGLEYGWRGSSISYPLEELGVSISLLQGWTQVCVILLFLCFIYLYFLCVGVPCYNKVSGILQWSPPIKNSNRSK